VHKGFLELINILEIDQETLLDLAIETGFIIRKRKINPSEFLSSICAESVRGTVSFNDLASSIDSKNGILISRQAVWKKMTLTCKAFLERVLSLIISKKLDRDFCKSQLTNCPYVRVIVQDSTIIKLPLKLFHWFSGVSNGHAQFCNARIQVVYDLISGEFISFSIDPYSLNDLKAAPLTELREFDLHLRDRGYLTNSEIERHIINGADCIYRYKYKTLLFDIETGVQIDLFEKLKKNKTLDMHVRLNNKERTIVRIVAKPVSNKIANSRRMKAKKENKTTPTKEYLKSLSWTIFITTITLDKASFKILYDMYCLRWRIEIIFKSLKSNMSFDKIHNVSFIQLNTILIARFIMIIISTQLIYQPYKLIIKKKKGRDLSLIKVIQYLNRHPNKIIELIENLNVSSIDNIPIQSLIKYCAYDKRKRKNYEQLFNELFA